MALQSDNKGLLNKLKTTGNQNSCVEQRNPPSRKTLNGKTVKTDRIAFAKTSVRPWTKSLFDLREDDSCKYSQQIDLFYSSFSKKYL